MLNFAIFGVLLVLGGACLAYWAHCSDKGDESDTNGGKPPKGKKGQ